MKVPMPVSGPHAHKQSSIGAIMATVLLALAPATFHGLYQFGWPAVGLFLVTLVAALGAEAFCLRLKGQEPRPSLMDGSALLTGWLLALSLPPWAPWWIGLVGAAMAVIVGKHVFGGLGQNVFNPAMLGRVMLLISFPLEMTTFVAPKPLGTDEAPSLLEGLKITFLGLPHLDAVSSASVLGHIRTELSRGQTLGDIVPFLQSTLDMALGAIPGSMGETSAVLILLGGLALIVRRIISWHIPVSMLATIVGLATLFNALYPDTHPGAAVHVLSGATLLGAFFIATDPVTSPVTATGRLLFGFGCGVLIYVIRTWAAYPEGMAFAILLMNALTPLMDRYLRPRIYGRTRKGEPIVPKKAEAKK